jgi:hypothetical protein
MQPVQHSNDSPRRLSERSRSYSAASQAKEELKKSFAPYIVLVQRYHRKRVETGGSLIEQLLPKSIHAVTPQGFELKAALFVIASSLNCYLNL